MKQVMKSILTLSVAASAISPVGAQIVAQKIDPNALTLPSNTMVYVSLNSDLTSKRTKQGDLFEVTVTRPVISGDYVIVPAGTLGHGRISWRTGRGVFGKSAKMDIDMVDLEIGDTTIPLAGHYKLTGDGNAGWTIGAVAVFGLWGGLVTGKSASAPQGAEFKAFTRGPVMFSAPDARTQTTSLSGRNTNLSAYEVGKRAAQIQMAAVGEETPYSVR